MERVVFKYADTKASVVFVGLVESEVVFRIYREVACVNVVALHYLLENLRLVHCAFLHKTDNLIVHRDAVVVIVVQLHEHLVFQLS